MPHSARTEFLQELKKLFQLRFLSKRTGVPIDELIDFGKESQLTRRKFLEHAGLAMAAITAAPLLAKAKTIQQFIAPKITNPKMVIVGAGIAGLNAAHYLKKAGVTAEIYEANTRHGGRIYTVYDVLAPGVWTELGGEAIDSDHNDMLHLASEFNLELLDMYSDSNSLTYYIQYIGGKYYSNTQVKNALLPFVDPLANDLAKLSKIYTYQYHNDFTLQIDQMSAAEYLDQLGMTGWIRSLMNVALTTENGLDTGEQSALNIFSIFNINTNQQTITWNSNERYKISGGNKLLVDALANEAGDHLHYGKTLAKISKISSGYQLTFTSSNSSSEEVNADIVLLALPFSTLREVELHAGFSEVKMNSILNLGYGSNAKLCMGFNGRPWRDLGGAGGCFSDNGLQNGWDSSELQPNNGGGYTIFLGGSEGVALGNGTTQDQVNKYMPLLNRVFPGVSSYQNGNANRMHWPCDPYVKGSYCCYKPGQFTTISGTEGEPCGAIYFAGEHCSYNWQGFMNGGASTGRKAAEAILHDLKND